MEFVAARDRPGAAPRSPDAATSWPGTGFALDEDASSRDPDRPSALDALRAPPPRWHAGPIVLGAVLVVAVAAVGGFLYYRYAGTSDEAGAADGQPPAASPPPVAVADPVAAAPDAGPALPALAPVVDVAAEPEATAAPVPSLVIETAPAAPADAGPEAGEPDAAGPAVATDAPASAPPGLACGDAVGEARALWRERDRVGALQKLRDGLACDPAAVEPALQWGRWVLDTPALANSREACAAGAAALQPVAEANPAVGELWFHYTNMLFGAGQREAAQAAKQRCLAIRPADEYSSSCRFLPQ